MQSMIDLRLCDSRLLFLFSKFGQVQDTREMIQLSVLKLKGKKELGWYVCIAGFPAQSSRPRDGVQLGLATSYDGFRKNTDLSQ